MKYGNNIKILANIAVLILFIVLIFTFTFETISYTGVGFPDYIEDSCDWDPVEKSLELSTALKKAKTVDEVEEALLAILELIGIGVYDVYGTPIRLGNERTEDDFFFYKFEIGLLAEAFLKENYLSLEAIAKSWQSIGVSIIPIDKNEIEPVTAVEVEKGLRYSRRAAEENPEHPAGFLIKVIDELGKREEYPFDLLEEDEEEEEVSGLLKAMDPQLKETFEIMRSEAENKGDTEMLERLDKLQTEEGQRVLQEAMAQGDMLKIMRIMGGEEEIAELQEDLKEVGKEISEGDEEVSPEFIRYIKATNRFFAGEDIDLHDINFKFLNERLEAVEQELEEERQELIVRTIENYEKLGEGGAVPYSRSIYQLEKNLAGELLGLEKIETVKNEYEYLVNRWEEEYEALAENREFIKKRGLMLIDEEEETSDLHLDPIQNILLHIDMFLEPRDIKESENSLLQTGLNWFKKINLTAEAQNSLINGGSEYTDAFSILNNYLSTAKSVTGTIEGIINRSYGDAAKTIIRGAIRTAATELHLEVYYCDGGDCVQGGAGSAIELRHGESLEERQILIHARIESPFLEALSQVVSNIDFTRAVGDIVELADLPDPLKDLREMSDSSHDEIPVRFSIDSDFVDKYLYHPPRKWDIPLRKRFFRGDYIGTVKTDEEGAAAGTFYLKREEPDVGGLARIDFANVSVQAMMNASPAAIYDPASWGLAVGEEIFRPVQNHVRIDVRHYIPVRRTGTMEFKRRVEVDGATERHDNEGGSEIFQDNSASLDVNFTNLVMTEAGAISGNYTAELKANWRGRDVEERNYTDEDGAYTIRKTVIENGNVTGSDNGFTEEILFIVNSNADTYMIFPGPAFLERLAQSISASGGIDREIIEEGKDSMQTTNETIAINSINDIDEYMIKAIFDSSRVNMNQAHYRRMPTLEDNASGQTGIGLSAAQRQALGLPPLEFSYIIKSDVEWNLQGSN